MSDLYPAKSPNRVRAVMREVEAAAFGISVGLGMALWWAQDSAARLWRAATGRGQGKR